MKTTWHGVQILLSSDADSVETHGLILFRDGTIAIPGFQTLRRGESIDRTIGACRLFRRAGSDVLRATQVLGGQPTNSSWFLYEHNVFDKFYRLYPDAQVPWDTMPDEPRRAREFMILLKQSLIAIGLGLGGNPPPRF
jgi:hypothetical protein